MGAGADVHGVLGHHQLTRGDRDVGVGPDRAELEALTVERRPRARRGRAGADLAVDGLGGLGPVDLGLVDGDLGGQRDALLGLRTRLELAGLDAVEGGHQQRGARLGEPAEQVAGGVRRAGPARSPRRRSGRRRGP